MVNHALRNYRNRKEKKIHTTVYLFESDKKYIQQMVDDGIIGSNSDYIAIIVSIAVKQMKEEDKKRKMKKMIETINEKEVRVNCEDITMIWVKSGHIAALGYNKPTRTVQVEYKNKEIWQYFNVPFLQFKKVLDGDHTAKDGTYPSVGSAFYYFIKIEQYEAQKMNCNYTKIKHIKRYFTDDEESTIGIAVNDITKIITDRIKVNNGITDNVFYDDKKNDNKVKDYLINLIGDFTSK